MRADRRRSGRILRRYWAYFCAKSLSLPLALALVIWEFSRATSFTVTGGPTFIAEPFFVWLVIRIGSLGAVLFNHAGMELVCCDGHGALYVPAVSSDYVQSGGWTALDLPA